MTLEFWIDDTSLRSPNRVIRNDLNLDLVRGQRIVTNKANLIEHVKANSDFKWRETTEGELRAKAIIERGGTPASSEPQPKVAETSIDVPPPPKHAKETPAEPDPSPAASDVEPDDDNDSGVVEISKDELMAMDKDALREFAEQVGIDLGALKSKTELRNRILTSLETLGAFDEQE